MVLSSLQSWLMVSYHLPLVPIQHILNNGHEAQALDILILEIFELVS